MVGVVPIGFRVSFSCMIAVMEAVVKLIQGVVLKT